MNNAVRVRQMTVTAHGFAVQHHTRGPWHRFLIWIEARR